MLARPALRLAVRHRSPWRSRRENSTFRGSSFEKRKNMFKEKPFRRQKGSNTDSIYIRSWDDLESIADAFALIRAVERKYGRIREFKFLRDNEKHQSYQRVICAVFASPESLKLVPKDSETLHIPLPSVDPSLPGGVGLNELQGLLSSQDRSKEVELPEWRSVMTRVLEDGEAEAEGKTKKRMLDVRIEHAAANWDFPTFTDIPDPSRSLQRATGHSFLEWGGFHPLQPLPSSPYTSQQNSDPPQSSSDSASAKASLPPEIDHRRMRMALTKWSNYVGRPDPSIPVFRQLDDDYEKKVLSSMKALSSLMKPPPFSSAPSPDLKATEESEEVIEAEPVEWDPIPDVVPTTDSAAEVVENISAGELETESAHEPEQPKTRDERAGEEDKEAAKEIDNVSSRLRSFMKWF